MPRSRRNFGFFSRVKVARKGLFGGKIASDAEVKKLNKRIEDHEAHEFSAFEAEFDKKLKKL